MITEHSVEGCINCPCLNNPSDDWNHCKCNIMQNDIHKKHFMKKPTAPKWCPLPIELIQVGVKK